MTYVYYKNDLWKTKMQGDTLRMLQESNPNYKITIEQENKKKVVTVSEVEDYSVFRNNQALKNRRK